MSDNSSSELAEIASDFGLNVLKHIDTDTFKLFAVLVLLSVVVSFLLARRQPTWFRLVIVLLVFSGTSAVGYLALVTAAQKDGPTNAPAPRSPPESRISGFDNRNGYVRQRPKSYSVDRAWFAYVGSFGTKENAVRHARKISSEYPSVRPLVFLYGDREYWGVALATWTTQDRAREAAKFAVEQDIEPTAYAQLLPRELFERNSDLYYFSALD